MRDDAWGRAGWLSLIILIGGIAVSVPSSPCWRAWLLQVLQVLDGPTIELEVSWEPGRTATEQIRLVEVDATGEHARAFILRWLADSGPTELVVCRPGRDPQGRLRGRLISAVRGDLGAALRLTGHAPPRDSSPP